MRSARIQRGHFEPREGFDPHEFRDARPARIWYSPEIARWELEKGARRLADGSAVAERPVGSPEWLVGEILSYRGEAVVLEPPELRREIVARAKAVQRELGLSPRPRRLARLLVQLAPVELGLAFQRKLPGAFSVLPHPAPPLTISLRRLPLPDDRHLRGVFRSLPGTLPCRSR